LTIFQFSLLLYENQWSRSVIGPGSLSTKTKDVVVLVNNVDDLSELSIDLKSKSPSGNLTRGLSVHKHSSSTKSTRGFILHVEH
jgi:hypothetical protein